MEFVYILIAIGVISFLWNMFKGSDETSEYQHDIQRLIEKGLTVRCEFEDISEDGDKKPLYIASVKVSGSVVVPHNDYRVNWLVHLVDETEGDDSRYALLCEIPDCADAESYYEFRQDDQVPFTTTEYQEFLLTSIPLFALTGPKKGHRKWRVHVMVSEGGDDELAYSHGSVAIDYNQPHVGYTEWAKHTRTQESQIAVLALAMAAADGAVEKRETSIIRDFFSERFRQVEESEDRKQAITDTLQSTLSALKSGQKAVDFIKKTCRTLKADNDLETIQTAYELCTKVAAADHSFEANEQNVLRYIASQLEIDPDYVREVHDREIRLHMYSGQSNDNFAQLGMPDGLSRQDQRGWLQSEYEKWRPRQAHPDPDIAKEANTRVKQIIDLLTSMDQEADGALDDV
jgi:tellurite resistance protein